MMKPAVCKSAGAGNKLKESSNTKVNKSTLTPPELMVCPKCNAKSQYSSETVQVDDYIKCINYINSCHNVINHMAKGKSASVTFPDIPNFLSVLGLLGDNKNIEKYFLMDKSLESDCKYWDKSHGTSDEDKKGHVTSDDERIKKKKKRTSSIPRLVKNVDETAVKSTKSVPGNRYSCNNFEEIKKRVKSTVSTTNYKRTASLASANVKQQNDSGISQQDLDKFAKEILGSYVETPNTTISSDSRSPSPKNRKTPAPKITYKTKSDHSLKTVPKPKGKPTSAKTQKKRSITICEPNKANGAAKSKSQSAKSAVQNMSPKVTACKLSQRKPAKNEKPQSEKIEDKKIACDNSDIEPDDIIQMSSASVRSPPKQRKKAESQYVVKEKPIDFFTKRRRSGSPSPSDADSDINVKDLGFTESDIDEDVFDNVQDVHANNRGNHALKITPSRALPTAILSNIGILTNTGKVKPEKQVEMETLRCNRAQDVQNSQFRQPRNQKDLADVMKLPRNRSPSTRSHSSDIKSDEEEEICTHRMDVSFKRKY